MTTMPELKAPVVEKIEAFYRDRQTSWDSPNLSISSIAEPCERKLWYGFRWVSPRTPHTGTRERLFQTGHREETRMLDDLRQIGCGISDSDPETGKQWRVELASGVLVGKLDARGTNIPGAEATEHVVELKTHNDKSWKDVVKKTVAVSKPEHFAQMVIYMHGLSLTRALYLAHNKNTDEIHAERVHADPVRAMQLVAKAERIASTDRAPERLESFACRWCPHATICLEGTWARVNCRTCFFADRSATNEWTCTKHGHVIDRETQKLGCEQHLFLPDLVPGEQVDADQAASTITYRVGNETYIDGHDPKPPVPERRQ